MEVDDVDSAMVITDVSNHIECCCNWTINFYNMLCCGGSDGGDDDSSSSVYSADQEDARAAVGAAAGADNGNENGSNIGFNVEIDVGADVGKNVGGDDETNMTAFELWSVSIEEAFHSMEMGDDEYDRVSDADSSIHEGNVNDIDSESFYRYYC